MPRPATKAFTWDVRITPTDQLPITDWTDFEREDAKILAFEEGGEGTEKRLHYHVYLETTMSESKVRSTCATLGRATSDMKGNAVFSVRKAHEGTIGYVVKDGKRVYVFNYEDRHIEEFMEMSAQYRKDKEKTKKRDQRQKQSFLNEAIAHIRENMPEFTNRPKSETIFWEFHKYYLTNGARPLPSRSILETAIVNLLPQEEKSRYYLKNILDL